MRNGKEKETWHERMREPLCGAPCSRSRLRIHVRQASKWETKENGRASDRCVNSSDKIVKDV